MRFATQLMAVVAAGALLFAGAAGAADKKMVGKFSFDTTDGKKVTQEAIKDKTAVFLVAQTACSQCKAELMEFDKRLDELKGKADVYVVLVDIESGPAVERYKAKGYKPVALLDPDFNVGLLFGFNVTPSTAVVKKGEIVYTTTGYRAGQFEEILSLL